MLSSILKDTPRVPDLKSEEAIDWYTRTAAMLWNAHQNRWAEFQEDAVLMQAKCSHPNIAYASLSGSLGNLCSWCGKSEYLIEKEKSPSDNIKNNEITIVQEFC